MDNVTRADVEALVARLVELGRWGDISPTRMDRITDQWAEQLGPFSPADVNMVVDFAIRENRLGMLALSWVVGQCNHIARRRAIEARTPTVDCAACARLGAGQICDEHRRLGCRKIAELRLAHGWPRPDTTRHPSAAVTY